MGQRARIPSISALLLLIAGTGSFSQAGWAAEGPSESALSEEPLPFLADQDLPERPAPLLEIGPDFLGTGNLFSGFELPTGAVWQPALWVFGDLRTGINYYDSGIGDPVTEWANRLDVFANLRLSGTERILFGVSPLRQDNNFSGYTFAPEDEKGFDNATNFNITTLFFEGEFGEIFPILDPEDTGAFDIGFAVGRQPLFFQEGMMINDLEVDALGITRDTIIVPNYVVDWRVTGLFGWGNIDRNDNEQDNDAFLYGLFQEADILSSTANLDLAYVSSPLEDNDTEGGDGIYLGASSVQRIGLFNTAFRVNTSFALNGQTEAVSNGTLLFGEVSTTLPHGHDVVYANAYWGIDNYASALRDPTAGGPLGQVGILFAAVGLGRFGPALSNRADTSVGGAVGYQKFFNRDRTQVILELGGTVRTDDDPPTGNEPRNAIAVGTRIQQALSNRVLITLNGFVTGQEDADLGSGLRTELLVAF